MTPQPEQTDESHVGQAGPAVFATTHWSVVLAASEDQSPEGSAALEQLCRGYWYPLYAYARRHGRDAESARDLTQEFFAQLLAKKSLRAADPKRGRFRTFLLSSFEHFLVKEWRSSQRQKRGGGCVFVPLDHATAEERYRAEPADLLTPELIFDRRWALTVLERALNRLREEYAADGRGDLFEALKPLLTGEQAEGGQAALAGRLSLSEGALRVAIHRLRQRYGEAVREEIAQTVSRPEQVAEELQQLMAALSPGP